jgi:hypothetical protein
LQELSARQQPLQLPGPHFTWQLLPWQIWPPEPSHVVHAPPPMPHALSCVPFMQTFPRQQPSLQLPGPHAGSSHVPDWQTPFRFAQF